MILVELYSKNDCHLCDVAKNVILKVKKSYPFEFREIKIQDGDENYEAFKERIPVIYINKQFAAQYNISEADLVTKLQQSAEREYS